MWNPLRNNPIWGVIATAAIFILGTVESVWSLFSDRPLFPTIYAMFAGVPPVSLSTVFSFLPLALSLVGLVLCLFLWREIRRRPETLVDEDEWKIPDEELKQVHDQFFLNEKVDLDGHFYRNCKFENCTFVFRGKHRWGITHCEFKGSRCLELAPETHPSFGALIEMTANLKIDPANQIIKPMPKKGD